MGTSAFDPVVLADVRSVKNKIDISGLTSGVTTFSPGDVIRYDPSTDKYLLAKADTQVNAMILGVVETINGNDMTIVYSGEINLPDSVYTSMTGATAAQVLYLSDTNAGKLTATPPSNQGSVIKPVVVVSGTLQSSSPSPLGNIDGIVVNTTGTIITGDSTVDLSDIQPVGSISAFAGSTASIPSGWQLCDGGLLSISQYPDLYAAVNEGKLYGFAQQITLTYDTANSSTPLNSSNLVGARFTVSRPSITFLCTILSGTVTSTGNIDNAEVLVEPTDSNSGNYHNSQVITNDVARMEVLVGGVYTSISSIYTVSASGGQPKTKFRKPDIRSRFIIGDSTGYTGEMNTTFDSYTLGMYGGEEEHTLSTSELALHDHSSSGLFVSIANNPTVTHNLTTAVAGAHSHVVRLLNPVNGRTNLGTLNQFNYFGSTQVPAVTPGSVDTSPNNQVITETITGHSHAVTGQITVNTASLSPTVNGTVSSTGSGLPHNNVPQHIVMLWIIKVRKDSYAKILKLGPSSGGAVLAKNTAKKWARMSSGAGATIDIAYGSWGTVNRIGNGNYILNHNYINDVDGNSAEATKYIIETTISKTQGSTAMLFANPYGTTGGYTFGIQIYDVVGATHSDKFDYLNIVMYGGGTAV
jgi:microcystin-dependent protein